MKPDELRNWILSADLVWIPVALGIEQALDSLRPLRAGLGPSNFVIYVVGTVLTWILLSERMRLDGFRGGWRWPALLSNLLLATALLIVVLFAVENVSIRYVGRLTLSAFAGLLLAGFIAIRALALHCVIERYRQGKVRRVVILGSGRVASELADKFNGHPELLSQVAGFLYPGGEARVSISSGADSMRGDPASVSTMDLAGLLRQEKVDELIVVHTPTSNEILKLIHLCRQQEIRVSLVPQPYELYLSRPSLIDLGGLPLLQLGETAQLRSLRIEKRLFDLFFGFALAVLTLPLVAACGIALRLSGGKAFRRERRIGWRGEQFDMLRLNVDRNPQQGSHFERMLWELSISELPQLWNVLCGKMSLVGPRPEGPERASRYSAWQQQRLSVKPGITGLAQVQGLREQHASDDKTRHDLQYLLHCSPLEDISLLIETVWTLTLRLTKILGETGNGGAAKRPAKPEAAPSILYSSSPFSSGRFPDGYFSDGHFSSAHFSEAHFSEPRFPETHLSETHLSETQGFPETLEHAHRTQSGSD
jgi:lipopolysaccharide/colanic/teichoic acid biosynthesis glycosyltransferase